MEILRTLGWLSLASSGLLAQGVTPTSTSERDPRASRARPAPPAWREHTFDKAAFFAELDGTDLWVGTEFGGVYRWDTLTGEARNYTRVGDGLLDNTVLDLSVRGGEVWVGHWWGLSHFDGSAWTTYDASNSPIGSCMAVEAVAGAVWVGTYDQGLFHFAGGAWTQFSQANSGLSDNQVTSIERDSAGRLWIGAWGDGVDCFDGSTWTNYSPSNSGLISYFVWVRAAHATDGRVWAYCHDDDFDPQVGIALFDGASSWQMILPPGIHSEYIHSVAVDANDDVWYEGVGAISRQQGTSWTTFGSINTGFPFNLPHGGALAAGPGGELWAATSAGLLRFDGVGFESHATDGLWDMDVPEVSVDVAGTTWMATRSGLHGVRNGAWTRYTTQNSPLFQDQIETVAATPDGGLLVGTAQGGAAYVNAGQWTTWNTSNSGIHSKHVVAAASSSAGAYWFGSGIYGAGSVSRLESGQWTVFTPQNSGLTEDAITRIVADPYSDAVWLLSHQGADRFDGGGWTYVPVGAPAGDRCNDVAFAPNGDVWFARRQGATRLSGGVFTDFTTAEGLAEDESNAVAVDASGRIWVGHQNLGLSVFDGTGWSRVDSTDGLTSDRVKAIEVDAKGVLWFGTGVNLGRYNPAHER